MNNSEVNNKEGKPRKYQSSNVLIVDNDRESVRLILETLACKGIRGHLVNDEESAIAFFDKDECDLVFTGVQISRCPGSAAQLQGGFKLLQCFRIVQETLIIIFPQSNICISKIRVNGKSSINSPFTFI